MSQGVKQRGWLPLLGPGRVIGAADDDPSGVATFAQAGARFGYGLLWAMILTTPPMLAAQLVAARIGRITGAGKVSNIRSHPPKGMAHVLVILLLVANILNIAADLAAWARRWPCFWAEPSNESPSSPAR